MTTRISSLDFGYQPGNLSLYPDVIDDHNQLYEVSNNALTKLKQTLTYNSKTIIVEDNSKFPETGLLKIGPAPGDNGPYEIIYYEKKTNGIFSNLVRGFSGSIRSTFLKGSYVSGAVMGEHHNSLKDAILNIEEFIGTKELPEDNTISARIKNLEDKFLSPRASFRAYPKSGSAPLQVRFQNFSDGNIVRYFWDFGDGSTSIEKNPTHTYVNDGVYTVQLNIITTSAGQGFVTKLNYITISDEEKIPFFYVLPNDPNKPNYSRETAENLVESGEDINAVPQTFKFVDQTDGNISQRYWVFDDNTNESQLDPDIHDTTHIYDKPGSYDPSLLVVFSSQQLKRVFLTNRLEIL